MFILKVVEDVLLEERWADDLEQTIDVVANPTIMTLVKIAIVSSKKISSCLVLVLARIAAELAAATGDVVTLPLELFEVA
jgi:hypothetical protein